jgi:hypothetical protein
MATRAALEKAIATNERYAANYRKAGKDPAKYVAKIAALKAQLPPADPLLVPTETDWSGKLVSKAAVMDATSIANVNAGQPPTPGAETYKGAALAERFSGVIGVGTGGTIVFSVFVAGFGAAIFNGDSATDVAALGHQYGI